MKNKKKKKRKNKKLNIIQEIKNKVFKKEEDDWNSNTFSMFEVIIIILISILFGVVVGYIITCGKTSLSVRDKNMLEIVDVYNSLTTEYYKKVDKDKLSDAAIKGMVESIDDPFTTYMDENISNEFNKSVNGSFVGIGVTVMYEDGYYRIIEVMKNSPALASGLEVNDLMVRVDDKDISGDQEAFQSISKGDIGSKVKITVKRGEEEKDFVIKRAKIEMQVVSNHIFDYEGLKIGYVKIESFASNSAKQFQEAMHRFDRNRIDALVIDVRNNPGGHIDKARTILSHFFDKKTVLFQIKDNNGTRKIKSLTNETKKYPIAVLMNSGSCSAAEILASAIDENYPNAITVGTTTYGKGTVQKSQSLNSGNSIEYTTQKWLTSKGEWIGNKGLKPTYEVVESEEYCANPTYENDNQLQLALQKIKESN